jgi:hypothetical protein
MTKTLVARRVIKGDDLYFDHAATDTASALGILDRKPRPRPTPPASPTRPRSTTGLLTCWACSRQERRPLAAMHTCTGCGLSCCPVTT